MCSLRSGFSRRGRASEVLPTHEELQRGSHMPQRPVLWSECEASESGPDRIFQMSRGIHQTMSIMLPKWFQLVQLNKPTLEWDRRPLPFSQITVGSRMQTEGETSASILRSLATTCRNQRLLSFDRFQTKYEIRSQSDRNPRSRISTSLFICIRSSSDGEICQKPSYRNSSSRTSIPM